jgi:H/ACA ribonucleoprotein complex subunit 3
MKINCDNCQVETVLPKPARFSPDDKYGKYRRKLKKMKMKDSDDAVENN